MYFLFQIVAGEKFCIVSMIGVSRSCRNDDAHKSASLEACPIDTLEVSEVKLLQCAVWESG